MNADTSSEYQQAVTGRLTPSHKMDTSFHQSSSSVCKHAMLKKVKVKTDCVYRKSEAIIS